MQLRPRALWRVLAHRDAGIRRALRWCYGVGRRAWLFEVREFLLRRRWRGGRRHSPDISLLDFWGAPQDDTMEVVSLEPWIQGSPPEVAEALSGCCLAVRTESPFPAI